VPSRVVLLTGASGLVGTWLRTAVPADVDLVSWTHRAAIPGARSVRGDLRDGQTVAAVVAAIRPSLVIHAAMAMDATSITDATRNLTEGASTVGADVLYVSTDAVFSGDGRPVDEREVPDPVWDYGRWKAEAEAVVRRGPAGWAVVRLPLVVSLDPADHAVARIRQGALRDGPSRWFHDETRQPAMASDIADALWRIATLEAGARSGVWQLPGPERLTRYDIARRVVDALKLEPGSIAPVPTPPDADRPRHINMLGDRARDQIGWNPARILT
jgi:dTDP-4-dehydrorhamnose reductase